MRRFRLDRRVDPTGVSGSGCVAQGVMFHDGTVVIRWFGKHRTTTVHSNLESVQAVHLHGGLTTIRWEDRCCHFCGAEKLVAGSWWCDACGANGEPVDYPGTSAAEWWRQQFPSIDVTGDDFAKTLNVLCLCRYCGKSLDEHTDDSISTFPGIPACLYQRKHFGGSRC